MLDVCLLRLEVRKIYAGLAYSIPTSNTETCLRTDINGGSCVNIITKSAIKRMNLKVESPPQPYDVTRADKTTHSVTYCYLVFIHLSSYQDRIWCDVLPMTVAYILLDRPWLDDLDVTSCDRSNTYVSYLIGKAVVLASSRPKGSSENSNNESVTPEASKKLLHLLNKN